MTGKVYVWVEVDGTQRTRSPQYLVIEDSGGSSFGTGDATRLSSDVKDLARRGYEVVFDRHPDGHSCPLTREERALFSL